MDRKCFKCAKHFDATLFTDRLPHQVMICLDCQIKMGLRSKADSSSAIQNTYESRIKLLEDNAFSDRAKRIELENKIEELEKYVKQLEKDLIHITNVHGDHISNLQDKLNFHNF